MKNITKYIIVLLVILISHTGYSQCENSTRLTPEMPVIIDEPTRPPIGPKPPVSSPLDHKRIVYWIHGYGGGDMSWSKPKTISSSEVIINGHSINSECDFPARKMIPKTPTYNLGELLPEMGTSVNNGILSGSESANQTPVEWQENYIIAHSFGGLAARQAEVNSRSTDDGFRAGGIVTFGTVHHGAIFANNVVMKRDANSPPVFSWDSDIIKTAPPFENFIKHAIDELVAGPSGTVLGFVVTGFLGIEMPAEFLTQNIFKYMPLILGDQYSPSALELQVGNEHINALQNNPNPTENVAIYGTEDSDLRVWKTLYWAANTPQDPPNATDRFAGYFEAGNDKAAEAIFDTILATYEAKLFTQQRKAKKANKLFQKWPCHGSVPWWYPANYYCGALKVKRDFHRQRAAAWNRGVMWLQNSSKFWDELTGALSYRSTSTTKCECFEDEDSHPGDCMQYELANGCVPITTTQITEIFKPSDGITLMESNIDFPNLTAEPMEMKGSSHFQMRNDMNTATKLKTLYGNVDPKEWDVEDSAYKWFHIRGLNF